MASRDHSLWETAVIYAINTGQYSSIVVMAPNSLPCWQDCSLRECFSEERT